jgi:hypothetical protein
MISFPNTPLSSDLLKGRHYFPQPDFRPLAKTPFLPILVTELASLLGQYVIGFRKQNGVFMSVILTDIGFNRNVYIDANGRWLSRYIPACLRSYPFCISAYEEGKPVFGVASHRVVSGPQEGSLALFDGAGKLSEAVQQYQKNLLLLDEQFRKNIHKIKILADEELLVEWPLKVRLEKDKDPVAIEGLYRIDGERLVSFGGDKLEYLKDNGVLTFALSQPMSMQHANILMERAAYLIKKEARDRAQAQPQPAPTLSQASGFNLSDDDMITF